MRKGRATELVVSRIRRRSKHVDHHGTDGSRVVQQHPGGRECSIQTPSPLILRPHFFSSRRCVLGSKKKMRLQKSVGAQGVPTDQDGDLYIWDAAGGKSPRRIEEGVKLGVVASPDRRILAWTVRDVYGNSRVRLYDVAAERSIDRFPIIGGEASVAAFLPDGKSLLTLEGGPATFRLWDVESGKERRSFTVVPPKSVGDPGSAMAVQPFCTPRRAALSPDGKTLAIGPDFPEGFRTEDGDLPVRLWDVATGKAGPELNKPTKVVDGSRESGSGTTDMSRWRSHQGTKSMDGRAFSPDGRFLVDWAENPFGRSRIDHVYVWDAATGRAVATLAAGPRPGAANAAFAPDGRTLAIASADGTVRLWEVATWKVRAEFRGHRDRVTALAFGPNGRLFTGGLDTVVLGWDVQPPRGPAKGTLAEAWEALASSDARAGFQAQGRFLAEPGQAVEWFAARVTPAVQPDPSRVKVSWLLVASRRAKPALGRPGTGSARSGQW